MIKSGEYARDNNPLKNAPHNLKMINEWRFPYSIR